jgi:signal transduction histidine kinase
VLGLSPGPLLQFEGTDPETVKRLREALHAGQAFSGEILNRGKTGRVYWMALDIQPVHDDAGQLTGFMAIESDITDLLRAKEAAQESNRAKSDFIANMSHELFSPLQSINGYAELGQHMARHDGHDRYASMFAGALRGGQRMVSLVKDLLDLSGIDASTMALTRGLEDLRALAQEVCAELAPQAQARDVRVEQAPSMPALPVDVDAGRLKQVVRNVLANAIRFAPAGSVVVLDGADCGNQGVELTVRDHGPGIPPDELELVFDAFVQSSRTNDGSGSSGLGLTVSRRIMTAHGGKVTASNVADGGTELRLWLPAAYSAEAVPKASAA